MFVVFVIVVDVVVAACLLLPFSLSPFLLPSVSGRRRRREY